MYKVALIGNPNVGKSTLFNSLTKSSEHTGNFHGVTVEEKRKIIKFNNSEYEFIDLPGMYSLNYFSFEEKVARDIVVNEKAYRLVVVDANSIKRNLYLCLQLDELNLDYKILINNYDYFSKNKNTINIEKLSKLLSKDIEIINAKKIKLNDNLLKNLKINNNFNKKIDENRNFSNNFQNFNKNLIHNNNEFNSDFKIKPYLIDIVNELKSSTNLDIKSIIYALNGLDIAIDEKHKSIINKSIERAIKARYDYIDKVLSECVHFNRNYIYGSSKADKFLLNPFVMTIGFLALFLLSIYVIFFLLGPIISDALNLLLDKILYTPIMNLLYMNFDNLWLIEFVEGGVFSSFATVVSFLPQVVLLFIFLTLIEDSGIIARMAYVFDDTLSSFGLNGKAVYVMLMGIGCNTMSCMASRNMNGKNLKIKTAILNPFVSCMARLPVFVLIASAFFSKFAFLIISGLYILGIVLLLIIAKILNKTILPTKSSELLLEFPPLRAPDFKHILVVAKVNAIDMLKRVFTIVLSVGIIVWILTHTTFKLIYTDTITESILFKIADKIDFIFAPIGLNSAGIVLALIVGIFAKEMILSTFSICNNALDNASLMLSLSLATSVISFTSASALSFLIFSLIYAPCISTIAVIKAETGRFYMWLGIIGEFTIAYILSFIVYQAFTRGIVFALVSCIIIAIILFAVIYLIKQIKNKKIKCLFCSKCNRK